MQMNTIFRHIYAGVLEVLQDLFAKKINYLMNIVSPKFIVVVSL